jgi:hypothetical protein
MSPAEAINICRLAKTISPAQAVDEYTPEAWALVLRNIRYVDAEEALAQLGGEQEWIHVSHIVKRVKAIRNNRIMKFGPFEVPDGLSPVEYARFIETAHRAIADGDPAPVAPTKPMVGRPAGVPEIEAAMPRVNSENAPYRRNVRQAHADAVFALKAAEPPRCTCNLDQLAASTPTPGCPAHDPAPTHEA